MNASYRARAAVARDRQQHEIEQLRRRVEQVSNAYDLLAGSLDLALRRIYALERGQVAHSLEIELYPNGMTRRAEGAA